MVATITASETALLTKLRALAVFRNDKHDAIQPQAQPQAQAVPPAVQDREIARVRRNFVRFFCSIFLFVLFGLFCPLFRSFCDSFVLFVVLSQSIVVLFVNVQLLRLLVSYRSSETTQFALETMSRALTRSADMQM